MCLQYTTLYKNDHQNVRKFLHDNYQLNVYTENIRANILTNSKTILNTFSILFMLMILKYIVC